MLAHLLRLFRRRYIDRPEIRILEPEFAEILSTIREETMTLWTGSYAVYSAVNYICENALAGDVVECGVWKGGSSMTAALTLLRRGDSHRNLFLYDTFEGMPEAGAADRRWDGVSAEVIRSREGSEWCRSTLETTRSNMLSTGYPADRIHLVAGRVESTIPAVVPEEISLLRLDMDWYEPTLHALRHLYPRLVRGGVLIIDDYGFWQGARRATHDYFDSSPPAPMLVRLDQTARLGIKV
jgi:O-methyltransferase